MKKIKNKGFTMVELLAVIVIIGLLLLIAVPAINKQLNDFRIDYYKKLESSVKAAGQDYIADRNFAKPKDLLYSKVVELSKLEEEGYIDEVKDYLGNACDAEQSYVVVVKTGDKDYTYQACLKCDQDEYETDTSKDDGDYCNTAWLTNDNVGYEKDIMNEDILYVYYGTDEESIKSQVGMTYDVVKKDNKGNVIAKAENKKTEDDIVYPQNIGELVGANINTTINLEYLLPNGEKFFKKAVIYKHNAPKIEAVYSKANAVGGKAVGDTYGFGTNEWASELKVSITFSDKDNEDVKNNISIDRVEYYDLATKNWLNTGCTLKNKTCEWTVGGTSGTDFDKDVKIRIVNEYGQKSDTTNAMTINVDKTKPQCKGNNGSTTWVKARTVTETCNDVLSGCSKNTFSKTYPTNSVKNKKTDTIIITDKAGNEASCSANFYVDSTPPSSCTLVMKNKNGVVVSNNSTTTSDVVDFNVTGVDNEIDASGIDSTNSNWTLKREGDTAIYGAIDTVSLNNNVYEAYPNCYDKAGNYLKGNVTTFTLNKSITITYLGNGATSGTMNNQTCEHNISCKLNNNAYSRTGYTYNGWSDGKGNTYTNGGTYKFNENKTLSAV